MREGDSNHDSETIRFTCQPIVRRLIEKYEWALLSVEDLTELVIDSVQSETSPAKLEMLVKHQYTIVLYEACQQAEDPGRRERGYHELFRFLYRAAYNRWPDLAETVTQQALVLVYEQLDRCQNPGTFLAFALNKLRQACTDELRSRGKDLPIEELGQVNPERDQGRLGTDLDQQERLKILLEAIKRLANKRQQNVILLKFFEGLSDEEIGERLQTSAGNVRVLRHRVLAKLRKDEQLKDYFDTDKEL